MSSQRQKAAQRRAAIARQRKGKQPDKSGWGRHRRWGRMPAHGRLNAEQRVALPHGEFLMAAGPQSVCGRRGVNHHMIPDRRGGFMCNNPGCPANC